MSGIVHRHDDPDIQRVDTMSSNEQALSKAAGIQYAQRLTAKSVVKKIHLHFLIHNMMQQLPVAN